MTPLEKVEGRAIPLGLKNVDTDVIIPAHWLKTTSREGMGRGAFESLRADPDNLFDRPENKGAPILIAGDNFGCGSSREHAPWALLDFGIHCVISTSFADIFYNNCFKNGILPIVLPAVEIEALFAEVTAKPGYTLAVDLARQVVVCPDGRELSFAVDEFRKECLLNGWDDIGLTLRHAEKIRAFEEKRRIEQPWLFATGAR